MYTQVKIITHGALCPLFKHISISFCQQIPLRFKIQYMIHNQYESITSTLYS